MSNFKAYFDMVNVETRKSGRFYRILNIIDILEQHGYGMPEIVHSPIDFEECTYSESFVCALEKGLRPDIHRVQENVDRELPGSEWHHFEMCGKMYRMYFEEAEL